jgi:adenylate cyclase
MKLRSLSRTLRISRPSRWRWAPSGPRLLAVALLATAIGSLGSIGAALDLRSLGWLGHLELAMHRWWLLRTPARASPDIVLIRITRDTPQKLGVQVRGLPLPRGFHAALLTALRDAGARAVLMDLLFLEPGAPEEDAALRAALARSVPLHVTLATEEQKTERAAPDDLPEDAPTGWKYWFASPVVLPRPTPHNLTVGSAKAFDPGHSLDGAILLMPNQKTGRPLPHVAFSAFLASVHLDPQQARWDPERERVMAGPYAWPVGRDGELHARWATEGFYAAEYSEALLALQTETGRALFRGKIVIVGDATGSDTHPTPIGRLHGMDFIAHVLNTLMAPESGARWRVPANAAWAGLLALAVGAAVGTLRPRLIVAGVVATLAAACLVPGASQLAGGLWIDTVGPCLAVIAAAGISGLLEGQRAAARARRFTPAYAREERPSGLTEVATVLFIDLRGSTALAERLGPVAAREAMSELLERLSGAVVRHGGEVERTLGDGLMAVFHERGGEPHALRALAAVRELHQVIAPTDERWRQEYGVSARLTAGMESGVISGSVVHAADHEEWSSFGPTVNLAARLQAACGELGQSFLIGPGAREAIHASVPTRFLAAVELKGFRDPVPVYTLAEGPRSAAQ